MDETKQNDTKDRRETGSTRVVENVRGQVDGDGKSCGYTYTMVYTQESLWVLDLRLDTTELRDIEFLWRILRAHWRGCGYQDRDVTLEIGTNVYNAESVTKTLESKS